MKFVHLRTLSLLLLAALLLLSAPAVADSSQTTVTLSVCEVSVVKDSSAQSIAFTINGDAGITSAFVAKGESVTISVSSIPSGKNLIVSHTGDAVLTKSGMTITVSNIQSELVTITMKLESAGGGGGGVIEPPDTPDEPDTPDIPDDDDVDKKHVAIVGDDGSANFLTHDIIFSVTVPEDEDYKGKKIEIIDRASFDASKDMDVYHQADIVPDFELKEEHKAMVHFRIPVDTLKAKGLGSEDACLYYYDSAKGWTKLATWYEVKGEYVIYDAEAYAFGPFAVVFEEDSAKPKSGGEQTEKPCEIIKIPCWLLLILILAVLAGIGIAIAGRRRK